MAVPQLKHLAYLRAAYLGLEIDSEGVMSVPMRVCAQIGADEAFELDYPQIFFENPDVRVGRFRQHLWIGCSLEGINCDVRTFYNNLRWNIRFGNPELTVDISPYLWARLEQVGFMKMIRKCESYTAARRLILSGDVETNPGPTTMSTLRAHAQMDIPNLLKGQMTHEIRIPVIEEFFSSRAVKDVIGSSEMMGLPSGMLEKVKVKIVSMCTIVYNLCRWSQGKLNFADLTVNLTACLVNCVPMSMISDFFQKLFRPVLQDASANIALCLKAILCCLFLLIVGKLPGKHTIDEFINRVHTLPRAFQGLESFWTKIDPVIAIATDYVDEHLFGKDVSASHVAYIQEVQEWADAVAEMSELYKKRQILRDEETMMLAGKLHVKGVRLLAKCTRLGYDRKNMELIRSLLATSYKISEIALKSGADKCRVRQAPVMVWFTGASGVGKSTFTYPFILDCMKADKFGQIPEGSTPDCSLMKDWQKNVYARAPETEYWDGYQDQEYIIYDDAFQLKDSQANPSPELFEIIRLGNMFPYMLHMAGIEEKGNTFSNPKLVVMSSNLDSIQAESIHCKEAVSRRIDFAYKVVLKEEYRKYYTSGGRRLYTLDTSKVSVDAIDFKIYQFVRFDPHTGENLDDPISYEDMALDVGGKLIRNKKTFGCYDSFLNEYAQQMKVGSMELFTTTKAQFGEETAEYLKNLAKNLFDTTSGVMSKPRGRYAAPEQVFVTGRTLVYTLPMAGVLMGARALGMDRFIPGVLKKPMEYCVSQIILAPEELQEFQAFDDRYDPSRFEPAQPEFDPHVVDGVEGKIAQYKNWVKRSFMPLYYKTRFNLPGICVRVVGVVAAACVFKKVYRSLFPKKKSLNALIEEIRADINAAEKCMTERGCSNCRKCQDAGPEYIRKYYYWGVPCACYVDTCERQNSKNKRVFMAHLNSQLKTDVSKNPQAQHMMFDFATTCDCEVCPLCTQDLCVCRQIAVSRGCTIGDDDLVDRVGIYSSISIDEAVDKIQNRSHVQNFDHLGRTPHNRVRTSVQNFDHVGRVGKQRIRTQTQNLDHLGKTAHVHQRVRVQHLDLVDEPVAIEEPIVTDAQFRNVAIDANGAAIIQNRLWPQLTRIYIARPEDDSVVRHLGHMLCIKGNVFLMNYHFVHPIKLMSDCNIVIRAMQGSVVRKIPAMKFIERIVRIGEKDACLVALDEKGVNFADIVKHFQPKAATYSLMMQTMQIVRYSINNRDMIPSPIVVTDATLYTKPVVVEMNTRAGMTEFVQPLSWRYCAPTVAGDCGAPLVLMNSRIPAKIVGIHNAGGITADAFGVPLYREEIEQALASFPANLQFAWAEPQPFESLEALKFNDGDNFVVVRVEKGAVPSPVKTKLAKSPIFGKLIPTLTKPSHLRPFEKDGEIVDPATLNRRKWGYEQPRVDSAIANRCTQAIKQLLCKKTAVDNIYYHVPLSTDEAIQGIDGVDGINSINKVSSPGWPYTESKLRGKGKTGYFGDYDFDPSLPGYKMIVNDIEELERQYLRNERPFIAWIDTLKDARIPIAKADRGKTRVFSAGPMHYCILYRKYFLPFFAHCMNNKIDNYMAPGINPLGPEWHKLAMKLQTKGRHVIAGDYSNYDGKACTEGYKACYEAAIEWYRQHWSEVVDQGKNIIQGQNLDFDRFAQFLRNIAFECTTHVHLCEKLLDTEDGKQRFKVFYQVMNGMPSGNPGTAITNSVAGIFMFMYVWFDTFKGTKFDTIEQFFKHVYMITYGDDVCANISESVIPFFNQQSLTERMMKCFTIEFTDEQKSTENETLSRTLDEITFLKRGFKFNDYLQQYVAPMPEDLLLDISNWVRTGAEDPRVITVDNLQCIMGELAFVSKEAFDRNYDKITNLTNRLCTNTSLMPMFDTYYGYLDRYWSLDVEPVTLV